VDGEHIQRFRARLETRSLSNCVEVIDGDTLSIRGEPSSAVV
jgi:endonuclease YncB( thermonuclease family)